METLTEIQEKMNADQYYDILAHGLEKSFENLSMVERERIFQQDNNLKHISKKAEKWFKDQEIKLLV